jgi:hypothetical protein
MFVRRLVRILLRPLRTLSMRLAVLVNPRRQLDGFELINMSGDANNVWAKEQLDAALAAIQRAAPQTLAGVMGRLRRLIVVPGDVGYYSPDVGAAVIGTGYLDRCNAAQLALLIVHEATHARLHRLGIRTRSANRKRIEKICIDAELAIAQRMPEAEVLIDQIRSKAKFPWWTPEIQRDRLASVAREGHAPSWVQRLVGKLPGPD